MTEIKADPNKIRNLGVAIADLKKDMDPAKGKVSAIVVEAGEFADATALKNKMEEVKKEVLAYIENVGKELDTVKERLQKTATDIEKNEQLNSGIAAKAGK
jgi:septation ring formation regulator EzrA